MTDGRLATLRAALDFLDLAPRATRAGELFYDGGVERAFA
jgi:hypothetical protein